MKKYTYELIGSEYIDTGQVPKGKDIYYRCGSCSEIVHSLPKGKIASCGCSNVHVDLYYFRLAVDDFTGFEVLKRKRD